MTSGLELDVLLLIGLLHLHRPEFIHPEGLIMKTYSLLGKNDRTG